MDIVACSSLALRGPASVTVCGTRLSRQYPIRKAAIDRSYQSEQGQVSGQIVDKAWAFHRDA